jgi:hypothetical protein
MEWFMRTPRKCLVHYVDAAFDMTYEATNYQKLGQDLEALDVELNPQVETTRNIWGENSVVFSGYEPSTAVETFFHDATKQLEEKIIELAMGRMSGDACKTSYVEALFKEGETPNDPPVFVRAYREDILIVPTTYGGDTAGVQTPFEIRFCGNRVAGNFDPETKTFTAAGI